MSIITPSNRKWWALCATSASLAMIFLDQSALPVALPSIGRDLHLPSDSLQWTINAYMLALAMLIILGGKLGDKFGHRGAFLWGMTLFILSSILCGLAPTGAWLITARFLQGMGGALMMPSASPLFRTIVGLDEFGKMIGLYVAIASIFLIIGPTLGGFFTAYLSWRWIFWINFPVALIAIIITLFAIPNDAKHVTREKSFDWQGFIALSFFLVSLIFALMQGHVFGWSSGVILSCFFVSFIALVIFIKTELHHATPFVDFKIFQNACISQGVLVIALIQVAYMGIIFWAMFLQYTLSFSPQKTGIFLLSAQVPVLFTSAIAGKMLDRYGPRLPVCAGTIMITISSLWMAVFAWEHTFSWLFPALVLFGIGSPLVSIGVMSNTISSAPEEKRGVVSGIISAARQVGGSIGLALLAALTINVTKHVTQQWLQSASGVLAQLNADQIDQVLVGIPLPMHLHLTAAQIEVVRIAAIHAYTSAFSCAMLLVAFFSFLGFGVARKLPNVALKC